MENEKRLHLMYRPVATDVIALHRSRYARYLVAQKCQRLSARYARLEPHLNRPFFLIVR
jgi:hypothetical protein